MNALELINNVAIDVKSSAISKTVEIKSNEFHKLKAEAEEARSQAENCRTLNAALIINPEHDKGRAEELLTNALKLEETATKLEHKAETKMKRVPVTVGRLISVGDHTRMRKLIEARTKAASVNGGRLEVFATRAQIEGKEHLLTDLKECDGNPDKFSFWLTEEEEFKTATVIECGMADPKFSWSEACILVKVNGEFAGECMNLFAEANGIDAEEDAKNE